MLNQDCSRKESQQQRSEECEQAGGILRFLLAVDRKYDQIMSSNQNDPLEGHFDLITTVGNSSASQQHNHKRKSDVGEESDKSSKKRFKLSCGNGGRRIVLSPGSNSSDVTTEQYMAESSKSSCFDDACTLPADQVSGTASTSHHEQQQALKSFSESLDLNGSPDLMRRSTTTTTTVGLELLHRDNKDELEDDRRRAPEVESGKNAEYFNSNWQDSWLQLGLGPSSRSPNVLRKPHENTEEYLAAARAEEDEDDDEVDVSRQRNKALLHLFPSESVQIPEQDTEQQQLPARHGPGTTSSHQATRRASAADESMGGFYGSVPPVRFGRAERSEQEFTGFLKSLREGPPPDTQLVISYHSNNNNNNNVNTTTDHRHPKSTRFNVFGELHPPSSAFHESSETGAAFHAGYNPPPPPPPGYESLGFQFEDNKQFMRSGKRAMQQDQYGPSYSWKHETSSSGRPEINFGSGSNLLNSVVPSRLNMPPSQPPEDWQTLIKRLGGGSLQFQSLFPNVPKGGATSSDGSIGGPGDHDMQRRRNLHDFQWSNAGQGEITGGRGGSPSWSRQLFGGGHQEMKAPVPGFQFSSFQDKPSLWQPSAGLLPFLPPGMQQHQVDQYHQHHLKDQRRSKPGRLSKSDQRDQQEQQHDLWFLLRAGAANQDSERLPQIPKGYLRVKDGSVPVSHVKKYLVHKLGLSCESEVEISCRGQILLSSLSLQHVRDVIWYSVSEREELPSAGKNIVMELSYSKRFAR